MFCFVGIGRYFASPTRDSFGFKVVNSTLYAWWTSDGVEFTTEITGVTITAFNIYRVYIDSTAGEMYFYVNGVLKLTVDADLPLEDARNSSKEHAGQLFRV